MFSGLGTGLIGLAGSATLADAERRGPRHRRPACDPLKLPSSGQVRVVALQRGHDPQAHLSMIVGVRGGKPFDVVKQLLLLLGGRRKATRRYPAPVDQRETFAASVLAGEAAVQQPLTVVTDADAERVVAVIMRRTERTVAFAVLALACLEELRLDVPLKTLTRRR